MGNRKNIRKWLTVAAWSVAGAVALFFLMAAFKAKSSKYCSGLRITLLGNKTDRWVNEADIIKMINTAGVDSGTIAANIDTRKLEEMLERNPWIKNAELYLDNKMVLNIQVTENRPVLRVFDTKERSYYLGEDGKMMPSPGGYAAQMPVFTGWNPADSNTTRQMLLMAGYINNNAFWKAQVQQIDITPENGFVIVPSVGEQVIWFGDTAAMESKFNRLYQYYTQVAPKAGWNQFDVLNVKFAGQLVAVKRNAQSVAIDSVGAGQAIKRLMDGNRQLLADSSAATGARVTNDADTLLNAPKPEPPKPVPPKPTGPKPAVRQPPKPAVRNAVTVPPKPAANRPRPRAVMNRRNI